jgi:hypothetical protein
MSVFFQCIKLFYDCLHNQIQNVRKALCLVRAPRKHGDKVLQELDHDVVYLRIVTGYIQQL